MAGDLNLKKSWNPALMKNREKVWKMEQQMLREHKEQQIRDGKIDELKSTSELLSIHQNRNDESGPDLVSEVSKTRWMYKGPKDESEAQEMVNEDYLLGKKKLTGLMNEPTKNTSDTKKRSNDRFDSVINAGSNAIDYEKEKEKLDKSDPLYTIKLQEIKRKELASKKDKLRRYKQDSRSRDKAYRSNDYRHRSSDNRHSSSSRDHHHRSNDKVSKEGHRSRHSQRPREYTTDYKYRE